MDDLKNVVALDEIRKPKQKQEKGPTQAEVLITLANDAELFLDPETDMSYASVPVGDHRAVWPVRNTGFKRWLLLRYWEQKNKAPGAQALQDALGVIEARAYFEGKPEQVFLRLAQVKDKIYIDLCNERWEAVEISAGGWRILKNPPVKFRRSKGMLPLPRPETGGNIEDLKNFVNIGTKEDWILTVSWLVAAMRPDGPYPVLVIQGEQGSAKSTAAKVLRSLIDPNAAPQRTTPRDERDLAIGANNSWILSYDNLSGIPLWLSDALCRVSTGGGFATRTLYENDEETIFNYTRPIVVNGIDEAINRHDLLDRSLIINLPRITKNKRRDEDTFWAEFEKARPKILGALFNAVAEGLKNNGRVRLESMPRMADFAKWITAAEPGLPWADGEFMAAYTGKQAEAVETALEGDCVAVAVRDLIDRQGFAEGTATDLLEKLRGFVSEKTQKTKQWPKTPTTLSNRLRRAATFLRQVEVEVDFKREPGGSRRRLIRISKQSSVPTVPSVPEMQETQTEQGFHGGTLKEGSRDAEQGFASRASRERPEENPGTARVWDGRDAGDGEKHTYSKRDYTDVDLFDLNL